MGRPQDFLSWAVDIFGPIALDRNERASRFLEEAVELAHAEGMPRETAMRIVQRVFARPPGLVHKEIGQAMVTLEILAENAGYSADAEAAREFDRVRTIPRAAWTKRHAAKAAIGIATISEER